jgi:hypothetical protein
MAIHVVSNSVEQWCRMLTGCHDPSIISLREMLVNNVPRESKQEVKLT